MPKKEVLFIEDLSCTNGIESSWDYKDWKITTEESLKNSTCTISFLSPKNFAEYIEYKRYQDDSIEEFSHSATYQTPDLTDYRYTGANPDNYVCFGSEASPCPSDNLYRVIGVIPTQSEIDGTYENRVKLIKVNNWQGKTVETGGVYPKDGKGYRWNKTDSNKWEESTLEQTLNSEYWNSLGDYQQYIETSKWHLGAPNSNNYTAYTPEDFYEEERSNVQGYGKGVLSYVENIGLMYPSDYGYSLGNKYKNESIFVNKEKYKLDSWVFTNFSNDMSWFITPESSYCYNNQVVAFVLHSNAHISYHDVAYIPTSIMHVYLSFYLKQSVQYKSGNGSKMSPYRIKI